MGSIKKCVSSSLQLHKISEIFNRRLALDTQSRRGHGVSTSTTLFHPPPKFQANVQFGGTDVTEPHSSTVLGHEVDKFAKMSAHWWSPTGEFKALHSMNRLRVPFIRDGLLNNGQIQDSNVEFPLKGLKILDVGCGGGILSLPLGRLGAEVTGVDAGKENIGVANSELEAASATWSQLQERVQFVCTPLEDFVTEHLDQFDGVVVSEVLEHVADPKYFLQLAAEAVRPGGSLFVTTINRTHLSWWGAIVAAEYLFRILPVGTHTWRQFVAPEEVQAILNRNGMSTRLIHGMAYNVLMDSWNWSRCTDINYALHGVKLN